jgi:hypothetical protein
VACAAGLRIDDGSVIHRCECSAALEAVLGHARAIDVLNLIETANTVRAPDLYIAEVGNAL